MPNFRPALAVAAAWLLSPAVPALALDAELVGRGQAILEAKCSACHATATTGSSPLAEAPPFRDLHRKYNVEHLAEALAEGIVSGHPGMPEFIFPPDDIDAIIAYLKSLAGP